MENGCELVCGDISKRTSEVSKVVSDIQTRMNDIIGRYIRYEQPQRLFERQN
jgi:hypothetical protein